MLRLQVPVDEERLSELLHNNLTPAELANLQADEDDAGLNTARLAMRLEKLLEKGVPVSDEVNAHGV